MKKRAMTLLLAAVMSISLLAGCGNNSGGDTGSSAGGDSSAGNAESGTDNSFDEHLTITVWLIADDYGYYSSYDENPVTRYMNDKFNMTLEFQQPPMGSEGEQFNLMLGTGEYTDVIWTAYLEEAPDALVEQGVLRDLTPYESYMPNYMAYLNKEGNEMVRDAMYRDGKLIFIAPVDEVPRDQWGGLVYRRDIIETMTGGNVQFPSGNDEPTTVDDWEYMLELMKQYFEAAGMTDYACLILPAQGCFPINGAPFTGGFGIAALVNYVENGEVKWGTVTENFYNYLVKMHEWYEKGYIYQDFASRTQDAFYLPNTALTYGGAAGIWYGLDSQLGDEMSMPEYGLEMEVRALTNPLDAEHGITADQASFVLDTGRGGSYEAFSVTTACSEEKLIRYLQAMDYMYTEEGGLVKTFGLTPEQANGDPIYKAMGIEGTYSMNDDGTLSFDYGWGGGQLEHEDAGIGLRFPGIYRTDLTQQYFMSDRKKEAEAVWTKYGRNMVYPFSITPSADQNDIASDIFSDLYGYITTEVPQFIIGTKELNEQTYQEFVDQQYAYGLEEYLEIYQSLYDDFLEKYGD